MKIEVDLKGVQDNEEIKQAIIEKIQQAHIDGLDEIINRVTGDYLRQQVERKIENILMYNSNDTVRNTFKEVCREKVSEFCNQVIEEDKGHLLEETNKITDAVKDKMVDILINALFTNFMSKIQSNEWNMAWQIANQVKNDLRNGNI